MILSPSILAADRDNIEQEINELKSFGVKWLHLDVMDGLFVPALTFDSKFIKKIRPLTDMVFDVHLMIEQPINHIKEYVEAGADIITFHYEAQKNPEEVIKVIKSFGVGVGISIKPATDVSEIKGLLSDLDLVLIMSVEPGKGGQKFIPSSLEKIDALKGGEYLIEVDGGVNEQTGKQCLDAGADILVAGSFVFKDKENIKVLKSL